MIKKHLENAMKRLGNPGRDGKTEGNSTYAGQPADTITTNTIIVNGKAVSEKELDPATREEIRNAMKKLEGLYEEGELDGHQVNAGRPGTIVYSTTTVNGKAVSDKDMDPSTREILKNTMRQLESLGISGKNPEDRAAHKKQEAGRGAIQSDRKMPCRYCGTLVRAAATECPSCGMSLQV